jgi:PPE-repeat protein
MYSGSGSGPMLAAATAWDRLATALFSTATGYGSVLSELTGHGWLGPASVSMANAAAPYVAWLHSTAVQAEQTAAQAKAAAAAYESAFAMTVPPPVIAANRALLTALVATNFFGQNTPAIAATEAHYAEMWLQDATAMYGYAGSSAAAGRLPPFDEPPTTTNPAGQSGGFAHDGANAAQSAAMSMSTTPAALAWLDIVEHVPNVTNSVLSTNNAVTSGRGIYVTNERVAAQQDADAIAAAGSGNRLVFSAPLRTGTPAVSAAMGRASLVGTVSVPPGATTAPEVRPVALTLPNSGVTAASAGAAEIPPIPGSAFSQSVLGTLSRHGFDTPQPKSKPVITRSPAAG